MRAVVIKAAVLIGALGAPPAAAAVVPSDGGPVAPGTAIQVTSRSVV